jgi:hypothetical protein
VISQTGIAPNDWPGLQGGESSASVSTMNSDLSTSGLILSPQQGDQQYVSHVPVREFEEIKEDRDYWRNVAEQQNSASTSSLHPPEAPIGPIPSNMVLLSRQSQGSQPSDSQNYFMNGSYS